MAACKMQRRIALRRKLQLLRTLAKSKSEKKSSTITDTSLHIHKLKLQVEAIKKECQHLINHVQEVKVENIVGSAGYLVVRVTCKNGEEVLASILEIFEELKMSVVQASITCKHFFSMEATLKADNIIDAPVLHHAILNVLQMHTQKSTSMSK